VKSCIRSCDRLRLIAKQASGRQGWMLVISKMDRNTIILLSESSIPVYLHDILTSTRPRNVARLQRVISAKADS
jgi:hypothetical protein